MLRTDRWQSTSVKQGLVLDCGSPLPNPATAKQPVVKVRKAKTGSVCSAVGGALVHAVRRSQRDSCDGLAVPTATVTERLLCSD